MVFDLGEVGINRLQFFSLSSQQGDADIQSKFLQDVNRSGIANEQVDGVVNRPSRGVLDRHKAQGGFPAEDGLEHPIDGGTGDQVGFFSESLAGEDS